MQTRTQPPGDSVWLQPQPQPVRAPGSFFCTLKGQEGFDALSEVEGAGWGLPQDPTEVLLLWSCGGSRRRGVSGGRAGEMVTKCFASPRTLGEGGVGVWAPGGAVHSLTSSLYHPLQPCFQSWRWISQPQTQSLS